jgi:hypothetical protein
VESGGTNITVYGSGFDGTTQILIGNVPLENITVVDAWTITGTTGVSTYGVYNVVATTGTTVLQVTNGFTYSVDDTFSLISISPSYGSAVGGNTVTFTGTCFDTNTTFTIGGAAVTDVVIIDAGTATGTAPAGSAGRVNVAAQQGVTESTLTAAYQYIAVSITSVSPSFDYVGGGAAAQITGVGFEPDATITIGGTALVDPVIVSDTIITGTIPAGLLGPANIIATKGVDSAVVTDKFQYIAAFVATSISPLTGYAAGGTAITITGTGFSSGAIVTIGGNTCSSVTVASATSITAIAPQGVVGVANVVVSQFGGSSIIVNGFTYKADAAKSLGDEPIKDSWDDLLYISNGIGPDLELIYDGKGDPTPILVSSNAVSINSNFNADKAIVGYASIDVNGTPSIETLNSGTAEYRNISLALMLSQNLTPFHFGAVGHGLNFANEDTKAFKAAASFASSTSRTLHIPSCGAAAAGFYYVLNEEITFSGASVTSDSNAVMVWTTGDAIKINGSLGSYKFPIIIFSPDGTIDPDYRTLVTGQEPAGPTLPWNEQSFIGTPEMIVKNKAINMEDCFGNYVYFQYIKGFSIPLYSKGSINNVVDFVFTDLMDYGIVFDGSGTQNGETLIRGSTIGIVLKNMVQITNDTSPGWSTHALQVNIAVAWLWKIYPKEVTPSWTETRLRLFDTNLTSTLYNKVLVTDYNYQDKLT